MSEETKYSSFRWFVLVTMVISVATSSLSLISPAPLIPVIDAAKTFPNLNTGGIFLLTMATFNFFVAVACIVGGFFLDKFGFYKVYIFGIIVICLGEYLVPVIGNTFWGLFLVRALEGIGTGPIMSAGASIAANYFPYKERQLVNGFTGFSVMTGIVIGLSLCPSIAESTGSWVRGMGDIWWYGIVGLIMNIIVAFGPKPPKVEETKLPVESKSDYAAAFKMPTTYFLIGFVFLMSWIFQTYNDVIPGFLRYAPPKGLGVAATLMSPSTYTFMAAALLTGWVNVTFFKHNIKPHLILAFLLGGLFTLTMLVHSVTSSSMMIIVALCLTTFCYGFVNPLSMGYISEHYPQHVTGRLGGTAQGVGIVGGFCGPMVTGTILTATDAYTWPLIVLAGVCFVGFICALVSPISAEHKS
jgi:MFS family permease